MIEQMMPSPQGMRIAPKMDPRAYRSFEVHAPLATHYRNASCREMECQHYLSGWVSRFDTATGEGRRWAVAVKRSGRRYQYREEGTVVTFYFGPGQSCFQAPHKVETGKPEIYVVRDGDWRGNPTGNKVRVGRPLEFVERMAENLDNLDSAIRRG